MALADFQLSYAGVTAGPGTEYRINSIEGIRSMPELRTSDYARLHHHGAYSGVDVLEGRIITVALTVVGTSASDFDTTLTALEGAMVPLLTGSSPMSYKLPSEVQRRVNTRARKRALLIEPSYKLNWAKMTVELFCGDPRIYDDTLTTTAISGTTTITNAGNFEARPVITVTPSSSPVTITNAGDHSNKIVLATSSVGSIPSPCVIDLLNRTVVDGGGANRFDVVDPTTTWFVLAPGANAITVTGGTLSVAWRSAWI